MTPATLQSIFSSILVVGMILTCFGTIGYRHYSKKVDQNKEQIASAQIEKLTKQNNELIAGKNKLIAQNKKFSEELEKYQQITISKLDELLESTDNDSKTKLSEKYPGGYTLFGVDHSRRFKNESIPHKSQLLEQYELDWNKVRICELTETTVTIEFPSIRYKPLNTRITGWKKMIPRYPTGKSHRLKIRLPEAKNVIFLELVKDKSPLFVFAFGFKPE